VKLALGTVQFGLAYGIANQSGQVSQAEIDRILNLARGNGIHVLDTAIGYGDSEFRLGQAGVEGFNVISKLPDVPEESAGLEAWIDSQVSSSMKRLNVSRLYGLLLHRSVNLTGSNGRVVARSLDRLKADGLVSKIGVSIYDPQELDSVSRAYPVDLVQTPLNICDRRIITSGWLARLSDQGVEIHARSSFLQGLLLMERTAIPSKFERWSSLWDSWHQGLAETGMSATKACLLYVMSVPQINRVVVGVDNHLQLQELINIARLPVLSKDWSRMICDDPMLINPSKWNLL